MQSRGDISVYPLFLNPHGKTQ